LGYVPLLVSSEYNAIDCSFIGILVLIGINLGYVVIIVTGIGHEIDVIWLLIRQF